MWRITILGAMLVTGCSFHVHGTDAGAGGHGGGGGGMPDMTTIVDPPDMSMPAVAIDMTGGATLDMMTPQVCTPSSTLCSSGNLQTCKSDGSGYTTTTCSLGCGSAGGTAHCMRIAPTGPVTQGDVDPTGIMPPSLTGSVVEFDTDTGAIVDYSVLSVPLTIRAANTSATTREVSLNGIAFHVVSGVGIWSFNGLTISASTTVSFKGSNAAALASAADLTLSGIVDARGYSPGALAVAPALCNGNVAGPGAVATGASVGGDATMGNAGGGGAGNILHGGDGGDDASGTHHGTAGAASGGFPSAITGGANGGAGHGAGPTEGLGGGGGGGVQLVANGTINIAAGGGVDSGGCGGKAGGTSGGGGGGGAGGVILVEAPTITLGGMLACNGGGGGAGDSASSAATDGTPGGLNNTFATGGNASAKASGGTGGYGGNAVGGAGGTAPGATSTGSNAGGGGGGAAGRIQLKSSTGSVTFDPSQSSPNPTQSTIAIS